MRTVCGAPFFFFTVQTTSMFLHLMMFSPFKVSPWLFSSVRDAPDWRHSSSVLPKVTPQHSPPPPLPCTHRRGLMALQKSLHRGRARTSPALQPSEAATPSKAIHHPAISIRPQTDLEWTAQVRPQTLACVHEVPSQSHVRRRATVFLF